MHLILHLIQLKIVCVSLVKYPSMQAHGPFGTELKVSIQLRQIILSEHEAHSGLQQPCPKDLQEHAASYFFKVVAEVSMHEHVELVVNSQLSVGQLHLIVLLPLQPKPGWHWIPEES